MVSTFYMNNSVDTEFFGAVRVQLIIFLFFLAGFDEVSLMADHVKTA